MAEVRNKWGSDIYYYITTHCAKIEVFNYAFLQQLWPNPKETADLVTFTEEIRNGNFIS